MQLLAHCAHPGAVGLVVEPVGRRSAARRARRLVSARQVGRARTRCCEPSGLQTGAPGAERQRRQLLGLAAVRRQEPDCGGPSAARRNAIVEPSGDQAGDVSAGPRVSRRAARPSATADAPERSVTDRSLVGVGVAQHVGDRAPVGRQRGLLGDGEGGQVVDAQASAHGGSSSPGSSNSVTCPRGARFVPATQNGAILGRAHDEPSAHGEQIRDERRDERRALGERGHVDELPFAVGVVADGAEPVEHRHAERGERLPSEPPPTDGLA